MAICSSGIFYGNGLERNYYLIQGSCQFGTVNETEPLRSTKGRLMVDILLQSCQRLYRENCIVVIRHMNRATCTKFSLLLHIYRSKFGYKIALLFPRLSPIPVVVLGLGRVHFPRTSPAGGAGGRRAPGVRARRAHGRARPRAARARATAPRGEEVYAYR